MTLVKSPPLIIVLIAALALLGPLIGLAIQHLPTPTQAAISSQLAEEIAADIWRADMAHALERHGGEMVAIVQTCLAAKGRSLYMWNPATGRSASVCELDGGGFGVEIREEDDTFLTAFTKMKIKILREVMDYLARGGYVSN
jgi:hypothetical protein